MRLRVDKKGNKRNQKLAVNLRKNMTKEERHLWYDFLSEYPIRFYRQKILGRYIVDFYCAKAKLAIEVDGSKHYSVEGIAKDKERTEYLSKYNLEVIRITNLDVQRNFIGVCDYIDRLVKAKLNHQKAYPERW